MKRPYEDWWKIHEGGFLRDSRTLRRTEWKYRALAEEAAKNGVSALDVGCASCIAYPYFKEKGLKYAGLDFTEHFVEHAKKFYAEIDIRLDSALEMPFPDRTYDVVFCKDLLEHLKPEDVHRAVREMWRVARRLVMVFFFIAPVEGQPIIRLVKRLGGEFYNNQYDKNDIVVLFESLDGFGELQIEDGGKYKTSPLYMAYKGEA